MIGQYKKAKSSDFLTLLRRVSGFASSEMISHKTNLNLPLWPFITVWVGINWVAFLVERKRQLMVRSSEKKKYKVNVDVRWSGTLGNLREKKIQGQCRFPTTRTFSLKFVRRCHCKLWRQNKFFKSYFRLTQQTR